MKTKNKQDKVRTKNKTLKYDCTGFWRRMLEMLLSAVVVALITEGFNQGTVARMLHYLTGRTLYFGVNVLVILAMLSVSELFKHRRAVCCTISMIWVILGGVNFVVTHNRTLPLASGDLRITYEVASLITVYFSWPQIIAMFVGAVAVIAGVAWLFSNTAQRREVNYAFGGCVVALMVLLVFSAHMMCIKAGLMPDVFPDRVNSYREYGFTTCFTFTFGQQGIEKPEEYSSESIEEIRDEVEEVAEIEPQNTPAPAAQRFSAEQMQAPNIIFLQLESFFDVDTMLDTELSEDPTPNFHKLLEEWPSATLYVPTVGGGTANVEFEVMSGMNMDFFGAGETPYNTIIQEVSCETIANTLREYGYVSTAMHNNTGTFFSRNQVYANLGYDRFDSLEYMRYPEYNRVGWAHDRVLTGEILRALESTEAQDLIFAIGVESHGKYGDTYTAEAGDIQVLSAPEEIYIEPFRNYVNIIRPVDEFLGEIVEALEAFDEPVILVIYGDHLPGVGLTKEMLEGGDLYASKYIIWNNYGAEFEAEDMQAYRLSAELLRQLGISDGVMTRFHQAYALDEEDEAYMEKMQMLEYDMLYGDQEIYGETGAPVPTDLQMGIEPVALHSAVLEYGRLMVTGENFTEYSSVVAGEDVFDTVFVDDEHLAVYVELGGEDAFPEHIAVAQVNTDGEELSRTGECAVEKKNPTK